MDKRNASGAGHREVLLVGSMPFSSKGSSGRPGAREVFELVTEHLGSQAPRIPDGEQIMWVMAVGMHLAQHPSIELDRWMQHYSMDLQLPVFKLKDGVELADLVFGPYGYADNAISSYEQFTQLRDEGVIPPGTRLQVTLPSPATTVFNIEAPQEHMLPIAEAALAQELDRIVAAIAASDLAIQWDLAAEAGSEQSRRHPDWPRPFEIEIQGDLSSQLRGIANLSDRVPVEVELGYHLCTIGARDDLVESDDTAVQRDIMNTLTEQVKRPITYFHLAVPANRQDVDYFVPLRDLELHRDTRIYLGLVYMADGLEGATRRIKAAESVLADFGVAAQCGLMQMEWDDIAEMLDLHRVVAESA